MRGTPQSPDADAADANLQVFSYVIHIWGKTGKQGQQRQQRQEIHRGHILPCPRRGMLRK